MPEARLLHPRHGTHDPTLATPARRVGSVRRTTTVDLLRPDGVTGDVIVDARGRDLVTTRPGAAEVAAESFVRGRVDFLGGRTLLDIDTDPARDAGQHLVGSAVASGFRAKVDAALPEEAAGRTLLHLLLDDLPGAMLVSGYAFQGSARQLHLRAAQSHAVDPSAGRVDLCAGFARDATMLTELAQTGVLPRPTGPVAPPPEPTSDPLAWHDHDVLPRGGIRRRRRLDLTGEPDHFRVDAVFRDSYVDSTGCETVIHEYTMDVLIAAPELRVAEIEAVPRVLPWIECPVAAASARRLAGRTVADLRSWVRAQLVGTSTCTHLNDLLRSLNDVDHLVTLLADG